MKRLKELQKYLAALLLVVLLGFLLLSCKNYDEKKVYTEKYIEMLEETVIEIAGENYFADCIEETDEYQNYYLNCYDWRE